MNETIKVTFFSAGGGQAHEVEVAEGTTLMRAAQRNDLPGIDAECGGACACGTCHVHIHPAWLAATGVPNEAEASLLEFSTDSRPNSRLSCQIRLDQSLAGLVVHIPSAQP